MSKYLGSACKLCRREGEKLLLKGARCFGKCALERKRGKNLPGQHGMRKSKQSEYAKHLREKQKTRRIYGLTEEQFKQYYKRAERMKGLTGENLMRLLELRLDNIVFRMGITSSRKSSRQIIGHGKILVNDKRVDLPNYPTKPGDSISLNQKMKENVFVKQSLEKAGSCPSWISFDKEKLAGSVVGIPGSEEFSHPINSQLIVELYSK